MGSDWHATLRESLSDVTHQPLLLVPIFCGAFLGIVLSMPGWWPVIRLWLIPYFKKDAPPLPSASHGGYMMSFAIFVCCVLGTVTGGAAFGFFVAIPLGIAFLFMSKAWDKDPLRKPKRSSGGRSNRWRAP